MTRYTFVAVIVLTLTGMMGVGAGVAGAAPGTWQEPAGGWQAVYQASSNLLPSQLDGTGTNKIWNNNDQTRSASGAPGYQTSNPAGANYAGFEDDAVTGERALILRHSPNNSANPEFALLGGTSTDLMTVDMRIRQLTDLPPGGLTSNVFSLVAQISRPPSAAQLAANPDVDEQFIQIRFRENNLFVLASGSPAGNTGLVAYSGSTQLARQWHDIRILWDVSGGAQFFVDGSSTPQTFSDIGSTTTIYGQPNSLAPGVPANNKVAFGDMGLATNQSSIAYFKITNDELAAVVPEPASATMLALAGSPLALRRRRVSRE